MNRSGVNHERGETSGIQFMYPNILIKTILCSVLILILRSFMYENEWYENELYEKKYIQWNSFYCVIK